MVAVLKLTVSKTEPLLRGQDHFWRVVRTLGADGRTFNASAVVSLSQDPHSASVTTFLRRLLAAGYIEKSGTLFGAGGFRDPVYRLLKSPEATPRLGKDGAAIRSTSARQHMWNIMRGAAGRAGFTYHDLMVLASTEEVPIAAETAKSYIQEIKATYLIQLDPGSGRRPAMWRLRPAMNTGPLPPMILRAKVVYDQNKSRVMGDLVAEEAV